ncbi:hypothetical protein FRC00_001896 [Tulasnella sp. 408]|nr:hypothetical protein FRC00_001896 [Tulasnella sp. 408]
MGSGRIWVVDLTAAEIMSQNPNEHLDIPTERVTPRADLTWPETHPLPWPAAIREQDYPDFNEWSAKDWSTDVEAYYPSRNSPRCFGGTTWFVNQALNIPGQATSLLVNIPAGAGQLSLGVEIIGFSDRLLAVIRHYDYGSYSVVLFDQVCLVKKCHLTPDLYSAMQHGGGE